MMPEYQTTRVSNVDTGYILRNEVARLVGSTRQKKTRLETRQLRFVATLGITNGAVPA